MRLIDTDALIEALDSFILDETTDVHGDTVREILERLPTIEERKTGKWMPHNCLGLPSIDKDVCSECGQRFYQIAETGCAWHYCPNCGADMRGEGHE